MRDFEWRQKTKGGSTYYVVTITWERLSRTGHYSKFQLYRQMSRRTKLKLFWLRVWGHGYELPDEGGRNA